jgi:flagellar biosynthesis chaperone FliJ
MKFNRGPSSAHKHTFRRSGKRVKALRLPPEKMVNFPPVPKETTTPSSYQQNYQPAPSPPPEPLTKEKLQSSPVVAEAKEQELSEINRLIQHTLSKLEHLEQNRAAEHETREENVTAFNGVSSPQEQLELLEAELKKYQVKAAKLEDEVTNLKTEYGQEKQQLEKTIKELKQELHRTQPIQDNRFFSLSKEIREAVQALNNLNDGPPILAPSPQLVLNPSPAPTTPPVASNPPSPASPPPQPVAAPLSPTPAPPPAPVPAVVTPAPTVAAAVATTPPTPAQEKEKKLLITGAVAIVALFMGGVISWKLTARPKVDQKLVDNYLNHTGQVQGAQTQLANVPGTANKDADVSYEDTKWENFNDPILGVTLTYPANVITKTATETSITFLRKDGYLFKVQKTPTKVKLEDYWQQIKDIGRRYQAAPTKWRGKDALLLTLQETADYPGNRYLVKNTDSVFDIWYAIPGGKFSNDDIKRAERMIDTISFLN